MNKKIFKVYLIILLFIVVSVLVYYNNISSLHNSIANTTMDHFAQRVLSDTVINLQVPYSNKYKIIGVLSPDDCSSCYSLLLNEFNNLINKDIKDSIVFYILCQNKSDNSFKENLIFRYRPRFPILIINKSILPDNNFLWFLKTPLFIQISNKGELINILQINISNQKILFKVIDNILMQKK